IQARCRRSYIAHTQMLLFFVRASRYFCWMWFESKDITVEKPMHKLGLRFAILASVVSLASAPTRAQEANITNFAAASMTDVASSISAAFTQVSGIKVTPSYAASSVLAQQIEKGGPADVFISADIPWMDFLQERNLIKTFTRFNVASNRLVLIAP